MEESKRHTDGAVFLIPLTPEAREALQAEEVAIQGFPFRVGRDLRDHSRRSFRFLRDRRQGASGGPNEVYLPEPGPRHHLSREHFLITVEDGSFMVVDRDSACGTLVEGRVVGGRRRGGSCRLRPGDIIIPGGSHSPFVFRFDRRATTGAAGGATRDRASSRPAGPPSRRP